MRGRYCIRKVCLKCSVRNRHERIGVDVKSKIIKMLCFYCRGERYFETNAQEADEDDEDDDESENGTAIDILTDHRFVLPPLTNLLTDEDSQDTDRDANDSESDDDDEMGEQQAKLWPSLNVRTRWIHATNVSVTIAEVSLALMCLMTCARSYGVVGEDPLAGAFDLYHICFHLLCHIV